MNTESLESIFYLNAENAAFYRSRGGLLAMDLTAEDGSVKQYDRVIVLRAFPLTNPDEFLSVREATPEKKEIGMIRSIGDLSEQSEELVSAELSRRYYIPKIEKILAVHQRGAIYFITETDVGKKTIMLRDSTAAIRTLDDGRVIITDLDGSCYEITDPKALDKASYRKIEIYL